MSEVTPEFVANVRKYIEIDDNLKEIRERTKILNTEKKEKEKIIIDFLKAMDEKDIEVKDGKLKRNVSKTQTPLKKEHIHKTLNDIFNDNNKATEVTDKILNTRPYVERETLKRTRNRKN